MAIKQFDKNNLKALRQDMNAALKAIEAQYGIKISVGNASFSDNEVTFKTKCNTISKGGKPQTKEAANWKLYATMEGLSQFSVGDRVEIQGRIFTIEGWNTRAKKSPVIIKEVATGNNFKCTKSALMNKLPMTK